MPKRNKQKGTIVILFAIMLPFLLAFVGFALDFGNAYANKAHMQNAADAAALAGAAKLNDTDTSNATSTATEYVNNNGESSSTLNLTYPTTNKITVQLTKNVPLYFLSCILAPLNITSIPVSVKATAQYAGSNNNPFNAAIIATSTDDKSIYFHTINITITGDIRTNGKIYMDNYHGFSMSNDSHIYVNTNTVSIPNPNTWDNDNISSLWSNYSWYTNSNNQSVQGQYCALNNSNAYYIYDDNSGIQKEVTDATSEYENYASTIASTYAGNNDKQKSDHIYYDNNSGVSMYSLAGNDKFIGIGSYPNAYTTVVVNGGTQINLTTDAASSINSDLTIIAKSGDISLNVTDSYTHTIKVIALDGNINVQNNYPIKGIIYAPNGNITIDGNGSNISGSIVGRTIIMTTSAQAITYDDLSTGSSSVGKVSLIE